MPTAIAPLRSAGAASPAKPSSYSENVASVIADYAERPGDGAAWWALLECRRSVARAVADLPPAHRSGPEFDAALALLRQFAASGAADQAADSTDLVLAREYAHGGWPGLLAAMLLVPAWQWPEAPRLDQVPTWLWTEYTAYLFYSPQDFCACGQASAYASHYLTRLEELASWGERNRGSAAVRQALDEFARLGDCALLQLDRGSLRRHAEFRAKVLAAAFEVPSQEDILPLPLAGRRLRVGVVSSRFGLHSGTHATLPLFEQLDPERFETLLFAQVTNGSPVEDYCRAQALEFHVLPGDSGAQRDAIRAASPDVVLFADDLTGRAGDITRLALHRLAALQVVANTSRLTSGFPELDLYVSGAWTESPGAPAHFTERLGLLPGPGQAFNLEFESAEPAAEWTRAALSLPDDAIVFVAAADYRRITPEVRDAWARLLAAVPGSRLLVHPFHGEAISRRLTKRFCANFDRSLSAHGVADDRLVVVTEPFATRAEVKAFLRVADIYLDAYPVTGASGLVDPLEAGLPAVVQEGEPSRSRRGGALLRSLNLPELIAANGAEYEAIARRLATDLEYRQNCVGRLRQQMECAPVFLDALAASDAFGDLIAQAYDELVDRGRAAFRADPTPLRVAPPPVEADGGFAASRLELAQQALRAAPTDTTARHELGRALLNAGRPGRAVTYLLAALQGGEKNSALWRDLAVALRSDGKRAQAIEALETSLRLDPRQAESWLMAIDLAESSGAIEFGRELLEAFRANLPDHPEIPFVMARLGC